MSNALSNCLNQTLTDALLLGVQELLEMARLDCRDITPPGALFFCH